MSDIPQTRQAVRIPISRQRAAVEVLVRSAPETMRKAGAREAEINMARADASAAVETLRWVEENEALIRQVKAQIGDAP